MNQENLLKAEDVASILQIKTSTVYDAVAKGRIPCIRLWRGQRRSLIRFRADDIEKLIEERTFATDSDER